VTGVEHILGIEISNPGSGPGGGVGADADPSRGPGVALARRVGAGPAEVLAAEPVRPGERGGQDDDLVPAIGRVFRRCGLGVRGCGLSRVGVSVGPGGYTSLRVACAAGKMIAEACGARGVSVPTARVVLEGVAPELRRGPVAVALASKGPSAWVQVFGEGAEGDGRLMTAADVPALLAAGVRVVVGDRFLPAEMRAAAEAGGARVIEPVFSAAACAVLAADLPVADPAEIVPLYPREPDAVTLWRARKPS
jgi:tRNA A37 threonylcarbamoyladenosine modification protein TsaB